MPEFKLNRAWMLVQFCCDFVMGRSIKMLSYTNMYGAIDYLDSEPLKIERFSFLRLLRTVANMNKNTIAVNMVKFTRELVIFENIHKNHDDQDSIRQEVLSVQ